MKRLDYRKKWDKDFLSFCIESENKKPTIITGDLNVAHREIDIARPKPNYNKSAGYTQVEIDGLDNFLNNLKNTEIHNEYFGSDHCPVSLELSF